MGRQAGLFTPGLGALYLNETTNQSSGLSGTYINEEAGASSSTGSMGWSWSAVAIPVSPPGTGTGNWLNWTAVAVPTSPNIATGAGSMGWAWTGAGVGSSIAATAGAMPWNWSGKMGNPPVSLVIAEHFTVHDNNIAGGTGHVGATLGLSLTQNLTAHQADVHKYIWGRALSQALSIHPAHIPLMKFKVTDVEIVRLAQALIRAYPVTLSQNLTAHQAQTVAIGLTVLQSLNLIPHHTPATHFHLALVQALLMNSALGRFFGAILTQSLTVHDAPTKKYVTSPVLAQALTVHAALANTLVLSFSDTIDLTPVQLLKAIYKGESIIDLINLTGLYVSPIGTVTTWAINTRTNSVTTYSNYEFNGFAAFGAQGLQYIGTSKNGVYELDGEQDDGTNIIADVLSGFMQLNNTKMSGLKGVYLAIRGRGQFILKLIAGDGREYAYELKSQPGLMNTKVNVGKGLRTRYLAFELISTGADFDLDSLEFVPMLSDRRI